MSIQQKIFGEIGFPDAVMEVCNDISNAESHHVFDDESQFIENATAGTGDIYLTEYVDYHHFISDPSGVNPFQKTIITQSS
jgi:hypothetical protein